MQEEMKTMQKDFLALLPCPLKVPLENAFMSYVGEETDFTYALEGNANHHDLFFDPKEKVASLDELSEVMISSGLNKFYYKPFIDAYVGKDLFEDIERESKDLKDSHGLRDPKGTYHIFAMNLLVMAVDLDQLGDREPPKSWKDVLDKSYKDQVAIRGKDGKYCETTLLAVYKAHGMMGIEALAQSVKCGWHPAQMVKAIGKGKTDVPTVSIMPYFYAKMLMGNPRVKIVWPEEGAIVSPITMMVKKERKTELDVVIDFFKSKQVREICASCYLPSPKDFDSQEELKDKKLNWVGWDFIYKEDIENLLEQLNSYFI
ncbi:MAG: ABC-type Fe3+ transport system, periplasmic component [Clostridia bacterium]|nr:ABC-type Fe3+ transport system, periplasmic component [Clostridia bacterium]